MTFLLLSQTTRAPAHTGYPLSNRPQIWQSHPSNNQSEPISWQAIAKHFVAMTALETHEQPDITVFRGWKDSGKYVWSPYVIKLETRLRFAGVRYITGVGSPKTAPKGKIPYIEYRKPSFSSSSPSPTVRESALMGDSTLITKTLTECGVLSDLNSALGPAERSHDVALRALLEDKLYFYHVSLIDLSFLESCPYMQHDWIGSYLMKYLRHGSAGFRTTTRCVTMSYGPYRIRCAYWLA